MFENSYLSRYLLVICLTFLFLNSAFHLHSQKIEWEHNYGGSEIERSYSMCLTDNGGYIMAGWGESNDGDISGTNGYSDYWVVKLDSLGKLEWEQNYGGSDGEEATSIRQTDDGGFIVAGFSYSDSLDVSGNNGKTDYWVLKLDSSGSIQWENNYGGSDFEKARSIRQTVDGGYIVAGRSKSVDGDVSANNGASDIWVLMLDSSGSIQWEKNYGGTSNEYASSLQKTNDGGYIVAGASASSDIDVSGNNGYYDYWILKLDSSGSIQWENNYGGSLSDGPSSIQQTDDGGFIVSGSSDSDSMDVSGNYGNSDYWLVKLDSSGSIQWEKNYGGTSNEYASSLQKTNDGGYIVIGNSDSDTLDVSSNNGSTDYWSLKVDSSGNIEWEKNLGGSDWDVGESIQQTSNGKYIVAGFSNSSDMDVSGNNGKQDYWIAKLDSCKSTFSSISPSVCDQYTVPSGSMTYTSSGTYKDTLPNSVGCDSIITIDLTINDSSSVDVSKTHCYSYTVPSGDTTYFSSGIYKDTLTNSVGCDSILTIDLSLDTTSENITERVCNPYTVPSGDTTYSKSGTYIDTISNSAGCDSILTIDLTINDSSSESIKDTACEEYTLPSGDTTYTSSGIYEDTLTNNAGCDSLIIIDLTIDSVDTSVTELFTTELEADQTGASYQWLDCGNGHSAISGETNQQFTATSNGSYAVEVTKNGCTDTSSCHQITGVGIAENELESKLNVHPNPTTDKVTVEIPERKEKLHVVVRDASGRMVRERDIYNPSRFKLKLGQEEGLYIVELRGDDGKNAVIRVVKQ